jgi:lysyl-tRNA synthetase class I
MIGMEYKDMEKRFPLETKQYKENMNINSTRVFEDYYFNNDRPIDGKTKDYREKAIDKCIEEKVELNSTTNNLFNMSKRFIKMICPICGKDMEAKSGGGNSDSYTVNYKCECGTKGYIDLPMDGIWFNFE